MATPCRFESGRRHLDTGHRNKGLWTKAGGHCAGIKRLVVKSCTSRRACHQHLRQRNSGLKLVAFASACTNRLVVKSCTSRRAAPPAFRQRNSGLKLVAFATSTYNKHIAKCGTMTRDSGQKLVDIGRHVQQARIRFHQHEQLPPAWGIWTTLHTKRRASISTRRTQ